MDLHKIVKKLSKEKGNILYTSDIRELLEPDFITHPSGLTTATYRCIDFLKNQEIITRIQNGVYLVGNISGSLQDFVEEAYWKMVKKSIRHYCGSSYMIVGPKSLELHQKNYESPDVLHVYNPFFQKKIALLREKKIIFQTPKMYAGGFLYPKLTSYCETMQIEEISFKVANRELTLLEALMHKHSISDMDMYVVKRFLKRHHAHISVDVLHALVDIRYISAINRLREISRDLGYAQLYEDCKAVIKKSGKGCFLTMDT